jgi:hypothetical protein
MKGYPPRFLPVLWTVCALLLASGLLLLPTTLALRFGWTLPWRLPGDARIATAAMHAAVSFAVLGIAGALWSIHMRAGWRRHRQRATGAALVAGLGGLTLSAVGVYYLGESGAADTAALIHVLLGLGLVPPFAIHALGARRHAAAQETKANGWRDPQPSTQRPR